MDDLSELDTYSSSEKKSEKSSEVDQITSAVPCKNKSMLTLNSKFSFSFNENSAIDAKYYIEKVAQNKIWGALFGQNNCTINSENNEHQ